MPLRHLAVAFTALALAGCVVTPVQYGKIPHAEYIGNPRCTAQPDTAVAAEALPLFFATSRLPDCREPNIVLLNHRGDKVRFGRFANPQATGVDGKTKLRTPLAFQDEGGWWQALQAETDRKQGRVLLYVHGYRETFETTSKDAAQIARMTGFDGPVIQYSWPSQGEVLKYAADETNMYWDGRNFRAFLRTLAEKSWVREIIVVSHSLGARLVVPAIEYVDRTSQARDGSSNISNIILASPDIDGGEFGRDIGAEILSAARIGKNRRITVYVSRKDRALATSRSVHGYPRLGSPYCFNPDDPAAVDPDGKGKRCYVGVDMPGLTIIDTSEVSRGFTGHSNFLRSAVVCRDFVDVVAGKRDHPERVKVQGGNVFRLVPDSADPKPDDTAICNLSPPDGQPQGS